MTLVWTIITLLATALGLASAGQVPVVDGVVGGVRNLTTGAPGPLLATVDPDVRRTPGQLRIVENSGVCETTPGVYQASGYADLTADKSIWFWLFAARTDPRTAPLILWFNGGPGSSSMIGLFQENGPCRITNDSSAVVLNPASWNTKANVLYIDQPVGVGFSHGKMDVNTTGDAAADVWAFLQIFLTDKKFEGLQGRRIGIWTESYGGHYGPAFAAHIMDQNAAIAAGTINGIKLNLEVLGIGNGLTNPLEQYPSYMAYAASNPYHPLVSTEDIKTATDAWQHPGGCKDQISACYDRGDAATCSAAQEYCNTRLLSALAGPWNVYYVPATFPDPYPPDLEQYLASVKRQIGAESDWQMTNGDVYGHFAANGDWMRNSGPVLERVIDAGIRTHIFDGDADYIMNYVGVEAMVDSLQTRFSAEYRGQGFTPYTVRGQVVGQVKNAGGLSYLRVYGAGHEVPAYAIGSLAALQMVEQAMGLGPLVST